jgi:hypothetical protein
MTLTGDQATLSLSGVRSTVLRLTLSSDLPFSVDPKPTNSNTAMRTKATLMPHKNYVFKQIDRCDPRNWDHHMCCRLTTNPETGLEK